MFRPKFSRKHRSSDKSQPPNAQVQRPDNSTKTDRHSLPHEHKESRTNTSLEDTVDPSRGSRRSSHDTSGSSQHFRRKSDADSGPLGLNVVYTPEDEGHKADIVFIHGLGGTSRFTWSKHKNPDLFWPLHFLSLESDVGQARILTFGYDADFRRRGAVGVSILDFAKDLLFEMKYAKDEEGRDLGVGSVPLLFVVHSMGGLIIKEAYIQGQNDPEYESIIKAIFAITFLATPHRGTNLASRLNLILTSTFSNAKQYISDLNQNSVALQKLNDQFRHIAPKLNIVSFYETRPTPMGLKNTAMLILEKETSILGYPGETSKALNADHHGICKYENPQDPNYIIVRNILKSLLSNKLKDTRAPSKPESPNRRRSHDLRTLLAVTALPDADYIFFRDQWTEGTGQWVLEDERYLHWFNPAAAISGARVLWLSGGPGAGKSIMSSLIINEIVTRGHCCQYFFLRSGDHEKRGLSLLLRSIAYQLARSVPAFLERALEVTDEGLDFGTADARMIWERLFKSAALTMQKIPQPLYWIIDGVDEAIDPRAIIRVLSDVRSLIANVRVLFVSRRTSEIATAFNKISKALEPEAITIEARHEDLRCYISQELDIAVPPNVQASLVERIVDHSQNNFLWVRLAVEKLNLCHTEADVDAALQGLPEGMEAFYDRMGMSIAQHPNPQDTLLATTILQCIATSLRVLTVAELSEAIHEDRSRILDVQKSVVDLCAAFAVVDRDGNVAMVHQTARQYLLEESIGRPFFIRKEVAHAQMFLSCIRTLMEVGHRARIQSDQRSEFLDYAATSWSKHLAAADYNSAPVAEALGKFLNGHWVLTWIHYLSATKQLGALVGAALGLSTYLGRRKKFYSSLAEQDCAQFSRQALVEGWATDFVKIVGKFGLILRRDPDAIYKLIPPFCPQSSSIYQIFGKTEAANLSVSSFSSKKWDDSIAHISFRSGTFATSVAAAGSHIAILASNGKSMSTFFYESSTFEPLPGSPIEHGERVQKMDLSSTGTMLATYGYRRTSLWDVANGNCILSVDNVETGQIALALLVTRNDSHILVGTDDHHLRSLDLTEPFPTWQTVAVFDEEELVGYNLNSPSFMALSHDGSLIAIAYRGHPLSAWEVEGPMILGHCRRTREEVSFGQVVDAVWNPQYPELFGLYTEGTLFKWQPYDNIRHEVAVGAAKLSISIDGNIIATGDARGTVKILTTVDLSVIFQLTAEEVVLGLVFSPDIRHIYDIRGMCANAWAPNALMKLAEQQDSGVASRSDTDSLVTESSHSVVSHTGRVDSVTVLAASPKGRLFSYGTDRGDVLLYDTHNDELSKIYTAKSFFSIEHLEWSQNGRYLSFSYSGSRLITMAVRSYSPSGTPSDDVPIMEVELDVQIKTDGANVPISQLLHNPASTHLAVFSPTGVRIVSMSSHAITHSLAFPKASHCKWIAHPQDQRLIIGVMADTIKVLDWELSDQQDYSFEHPSPLHGESHLSAEHDAKATSAPSPSITTDVDGAHIDRVIVTHGRTQLMLVQMSFRRSGSRKTLFLSFRTSWLAKSQSPWVKKGSGMEEPPVTANAVLHPTHFFPFEVANDIMLALNFVSGDRLLFLSRASAICSWRGSSGSFSTLHTSHSYSGPSPVSLPHNARSMPVRASRPHNESHRSFPDERPVLPTRSSLGDAVDRNASTRSKGSSFAPPASVRPTGQSTSLSKPIFYLPGDWMNRDLFAQCVLWDKEKSLLCPRNGEVEVVKCVALA